MLSASDPFDLERFVIAQEFVYPAVIAELRLGRKRTHWMWFIFPQLRGLGSSAMARRYGIDSFGEARAYLLHPVLSTRLQTCTSLVVEARARTLREIFGEPDDAKFHSCMTLFSLVSGDGDSIFSEALECFFDGRLDEKTRTMLRTE